MSDPASELVRPWRSHIIAIVRHPVRSLVLLQHDSLPVWTFEPIVYASDAQRLAAELRGSLGMDGVLLGSAWGSFEPAQRQLRAAVVFVVRDQHWAPPAGARWTAEVEPQALPWPDEALHTGVAALLSQPPDADVPLRSPWAKPGFFERATAWIAEGLSAAGWQLAEPVQQFRCWGISCVLRAATSNGDVYFKAAGGSDLFADEPAVMEALAQHYPDLVPAPLMREPEQRWMLLPNLGTPVRESNDVELRVAAMTAYGRMQVALAGQVEQLLAAGLHDRRLHTLPEQLQVLLDDPDVQAVLGDELYTRLAAAAPSLLRICEQLARYNIPASVVHGDLHGGNVAYHEGRFQVFDWTDASLAHPFLDLATFLPSRSRPEDAALADRMMAEYLRLWEQYEPPARLREILRLSGIAGALHQVVSYRHILMGIEPMSRWENADGLIEFATELLDTLDSFESGN